MLNHYILELVIAVIAELIAKAIWQAIHRK